MDREILAQNGVYFQEDPLEVQTLPSHVAALRNAILDFDCTIPDRFGLDTDEDIRNIDDIYKDLGVSEYERNLITESLAHDKSTKEHAEKLCRGKDREREWESFFKDYFFNPLANEMKIIDKDLRRTSRTKYYYDYFEHAQSRHWTLFGGVRGFRKADRQGLTEPRPDWVAFYPIYDFSAGNIGDRIPTSARWRWKHSPKDSIVENFSLKTLEHLAQHGLESNSAGVFRSGRKAPIEPSDCICYPWFIVEHKKADHRVETQCYCQAANAGAATLMMLQTLSKYAEKRNHDRQIPPVATMTTVGEVVRIWIAYSCDGSTKFRMNCIWQGNMTKILDLIQFRAILENLHTWAMRVLRPWISSYIDQWRARFPRAHEIHHEQSAGVTGSRMATLGGLGVGANAIGAEAVVQEMVQEILQTEHQKLRDQMVRLEQNLTESLDNHRRHYSTLMTRSIGVQTISYSTSRGTQSHVEWQATRPRMTVAHTVPSYNENVFTFGIRIPFKGKIIRIKLPNPDLVKLHKEKQRAELSLNVTAVKRSTSSNSNAESTMEATYASRPSASTTHRSVTSLSRQNMHPGAAASQVQPPVIFSGNRFDGLAFDFNTPIWRSVSAHFESRVSMELPSSEVVSDPQGSHRLDTKSEQGPPGDDPDDSDYVDNSDDYEDEEENDRETGDESDKDSREHEEVRQELKELKEELKEDITWLEDKFDEIEEPKESGEDEESSGDDPEESEEDEESSGDDPEDSNYDSENEEEDDRENEGEADEDFGDPEELREELRELNEERMEDITWLREKLDEIEEPEESEEGEESSGNDRDDSAYTYESDGSKNQEDDTETRYEAVLEEGRKRLEELRELSERILRLSENSEESELVKD